MKVFIPICLLSFYAYTVHAATPQQAQASALVVPGEEAQLPYASALVIVQCKQAVSVVLIDHQGHQHPLHLKDSSQAMLLTQLSQVPADSVTEIEVTCSNTTTI
jgi:hypothetical protein